MLTERAGLEEQYLAAQHTTADLIAELRAAIRKLLAIGAMSAQEIARFYALAEGTEDDG